MTLHSVSVAPKFNYQTTENLNLFAKVGAAYMTTDSDNDVVATRSCGRRIRCSQQRKTACRTATLQRHGRWRDLRSGREHLHRW